ncbi:MAG: WD40 repeat domain-containing protein [Planctomycetes bacterium]|nr:WD40 repeat domain-containing protein [Planctomycetota bacterium]
MNAQPKKDPAPPAAPVIDIKLVREVGVGCDLLAVAAVPGAAKAYAGGSDGKLYLIDFDDAKSMPVTWAAHTGYVSGLARAGKYLVSGGSDHHLIWWDTETREKVRGFETHDKKWVRSVAASPDGKLVASAGDDMVGRLWDAESGKLVHELVGHDKLTPYGLVSKLYCCRFSPDGRHLATGDQTGTAIVWDVGTGKQVARVRAPSLYTADTNGHTYGGVRALAFSPDGTRLALAGNIAGDTSTITNSKALAQVFDWKAGKMTQDIPVKVNAFFEAIAFHPKEPWLFAATGAGEGKKVLILDVEKASVLQEITSNIPVFDMALNATADTLVAVGRKKAFCWRLSR